MKRIKSFHYNSGWGGVENTTNQVNEEIQKLNSKGIEEVDLDITSAGNGVMYTLIWNE